MTALEWILSFSLLTIYLTCIVTVCMLTFQKGHTLLGIVGIFFPILWLVGAILPAKEGSRFAAQQAASQRAQVAQPTR